MINAIREWLAFWLLEKVLRIMPVSSSARLGMLRGLKEQRDYDRYEAYCGLMATLPLSFSRWRETRQMLVIKAHGAEQANATLRAAGRPAFLPAVSRL